MKIEIAPPLAPRNIFLCTFSIEAPKAESIEDSSVSIDTEAAAKLIALVAEYTGLSYLRYFTVFIIAKVNDVKVYAAIAIVVISW